MAVTIKIIPKIINTLNLEIIKHKPRKRKYKHPLLFIHGMWHNAFCWDEHFLPYFAKKGFEVYALSLRGHGNSEGKEKIRCFTLKDYMKDLESVISDLPGTPVLIGHSMGCLLAQKYLQKCNGPAGVLLAPAPSKHYFHITKRFYKLNPRQFLKTIFTFNLHHIVNKKELTKNNFFSNDIDDKKLDKYFKHIDNESFLLFLELLSRDLFRSLLKPHTITSPMLVLGALDDKIVSIEDIKTTANSLKSNLQLFEGITHDMMLEKKWKIVADAIIRWLHSVHDKAK